MSAPIPLRLEDDVRAELDMQARSRGIGLAALLCEPATRAARQARIREASVAVGAHVATSAHGGAFYEGWGTPCADAG